MSRIIRGDEEKAIAAVALPGGVTNDYLLELLDLEIDGNQAVRSSSLQYLSAWIRRKFGRGKEKIVFAVQDAEGIWHRKTLDNMSNSELAQLEERDRMILTQTEGRAEQIRTRMALYEAKRRQLDLFENEVPEKNAKVIHMGG